MGGVIGAGLDMFGIGDGEAQRTTRTTSETDQEVKRTLGDLTSNQRQGDVLIKKELPDFTKDIGKLFDRTGKDAQKIDNAFRDLLISFSTGTLQPTKQQIKQATSFVDQTFTAPAQQQYGLFLDRAAETQANRAAAMGRSSQDPAYQREFAAEAGRVAQDLANQRGSLIAQRADELAYARPSQQLAALSSGSQYFNQAANQAINNRLQLMNAATQQQQLGLARQSALGGTTVKTKGFGSNIAPDASIGQKIGAFQGAMDDEFFKTANIISMGYGLGGGGGGGDFTYEGLPGRGGAVGAQTGGYNLGNIGSGFGAQTYGSNPMSSGSPSLGSFKF